MEKINMKNSFAFKLSLSIITCVVATFLFVLVYNYQVSKDTIIEDARENTMTLAESTLNQVNTVLTGVQKIPEVLAYILESMDLPEPEINSLIKTIVADNTEVYGSTIAFEPYMFSKDKYYFAPYYYELKNGEVKSKDLGGDYDYFKWNWYTEPKKLQKGVWSSPYFDKGGGDILMITYSLPFYKKINGTRTFSGVITCDISLEWLIRLVSNFKIYQTGYTFLLGADGRYIVHRNRSHILNETIFTLADKRNDHSLKELGEKMIHNQQGFEKYFSHTLNTNCFIAYLPLKMTGWSMGVVAPETELLSDLKTVTIKLFVIGVLGYILTLVLIVVMSNRVTSPLRNLANATFEIGEGDFNAKIPAIKSSDEVGMLSRSFISMQENLIKYIANLKETTAAKEKIERDLIIAREIQQSLLPKDFPALRQLEVYAMVDPAKEVGGDIYDFFFIDDKHFCFAIGDVSGKGVPASLFMAITKTLLRAKIVQGTTPAAILKAMNEELSKNNDSAMFVTYFIGILDIETGIMEYSNAGHNPPAVYSKDRGFHYFDMKVNSILGFMNTEDYVSEQYKLSPGDIIFLYTDGVTEAMNAADEQFGEEKLLEVLTGNKNKNAKELVESIDTEIRKHVGDAEQSDDITMMALKFNDK